MMKTAAERTAAWFGLALSAFPMTMTINALRRPRQKGCYRLS